jgi:hypothetical protein
MNKDEYIKKLERRIHNQRVALRMNWEIIEMRMRHLGRGPIRSMWWDKVKSLIKENKELRQQIMIEKEKK